VEEVSSLVTRVESSKKAVAKSLQVEEVAPESQEDIVIDTTMQLAREFGTSTQQFVKKKALEDAQKSIQFSEEIKSIAAEEVGVMLKETMKVKREAARSEALEGNSSIHTYDINTLDLDPSSLTHIDHFDDIPIQRVYQDLQRNLAPLPSTKTHKKPDDADVPEQQFIDDRIGVLVQTRINVTKKLLVDQ